MKLDQHAKNLRQLRAGHLQHSLTASSKQQGAIMKLFKALSITSLGLVSNVSGFDCSVAFLSKGLNSTIKVTSARTLPAGSTFHVPATDLGFPKSPTNLPALCLVQGNVTQIPEAPYSFAIFLPNSWNGRTLTVGGGGFAGGVPWSDMGTGVQYGFSVVGTDFGHNSNSSDARWAYHAPEKQANWYVHPLCRLV